MSGLRPCKFNSFTQKLMPDVACFTNSSNFQLQKLFKANLSNKAPKPPKSIVWKFPTKKIEHV